jgi:hypothetical protein
MYFDNDNIKAIFHIRIDFDYNISVGVGVGLDHEDKKEFLSHKDKRYMVDYLDENVSRTDDLNLRDIINKIKLKYYFGD